MFIDANIFITSIIGRGKAAENCKKFLKKLESGEQKALTSILVMDEVLNVLEIRSNSREYAVLCTQKFLSLSNLKIVDVSRIQFENSLHFFKAGLGPHDAMHISVMRSYGVDTILSYDKDFDSLKEFRRIEP